MSVVLPDPAGPVIQVIGLFLFLSSSWNNLCLGKMFESLGRDILVIEVLLLVICQDIVYPWLRH